MKYAVLAALPMLALVTQAQAAPVVTYSQYLPSSPSSIFAPIPTSTNTGTYYTTVSSTDPSDATYVGLTQSYPGIARSPFEGVSGFGSAPYDSVSGGGYACFGFCGVSEVAFQKADATSGSGSFSFIYGSPDSYNTLTLYTDTGVYPLTGSALTVPNPPSGLGYEYVTISGVGNIYGAQFASSQPAFEFAFVSAVPLPASAPMFGAALLALGVVGYGVKRKAKATA